MSKLKVDDIQSRQSTDDAISLASDSSVSLKHSASAKLTTTSTGVTVTGTCTATAFSGDGSALTGVSSGVTVQEEGSSLSTAGTTLNFVGAGVTASGTGTTKTITVPGGGGALEYVKTIQPSSNVSTIVETGLEYDRVYKIVLSELSYSAGSALMVKPHVDNSSSPHNNSDCQGGYVNKLTFYSSASYGSNVGRSPEYSGYKQQDAWSIYPGHNPSFHSGILELYTGKKSWLFWRFYAHGDLSDSHTTNDYQGWVTGFGDKSLANNTNNDSNQTDTYAKVNGFTLQDIFGASYTSETKIVLYKYKES